MQLQVRVLRKHFNQSQRHRRPVGDQQTFVLWQLSQETLHQLQSEGQCLPYQLKVVVACGGGAAGGQGVSYLVNCKTANKTTTEQQHQEDGQNDVPLSVRRAL